MYSKDYLLNQIKEFNIPKNSAILVHTSLKAIGQIEGGAETLLDALIEYCNGINTLVCIPTHTWARFFIDDPIKLDVNSNEVCIGTFPRIALERGDGIRSLHPSHSMVVFGDKNKAKRLADLDDNCATPTGPDGCYGEVLKLGGAVLLIGVDLNKNTFMHCIEEKMNVQNRLTEPWEAKVKLKNGDIIDHPIAFLDPVDIGDVSHKFYKYEKAFRKYNGIQDGFIGDAKSMLVDCKITDTVMSLINKNSNGVELLADDEEINELYY